MQGVRWAEEVVDNEFMNKKKSKSASRLCIQALLLTRARMFADPVGASCSQSLCLFLQSAASFTRSGSLANGVMMRIATQNAIVQRDSSTRHMCYNDVPLFSFYCCSNLICLAILFC